MEDNLRWKTTFDRVYSILPQKKKRLRHLTLTATAQLTLNRKSYQLSKPEIEFHVMEEMYAALRLCTCEEKTTVLGKDDSSIVDWGRVIMGLRATLPNHIPACRSEFKLSIMTSFSIVETVKEASAVCRSFLDGVVIFFI